MTDILLTPVIEMTAAEDLEKLSTELVKQASELHQKKAEVLSLIQEAKAENEKVTARKNLFTTTPVAKPKERATCKTSNPRSTSPLLKGLALNGRQRRKGRTKTETQCCVRLC